MREALHNEVVLEARGLVKDFPGQRALDRVDFEIRRGEVHALIGENGAGKSTLIKIIAGFYRADEGTLMVDGRRREFNNPLEAQQAGLSFIHQELNIIPHLSAAENMFLGRRKPRNTLGLVSQKRMVASAGAIPNALPLQADLKTPAGMLSIIQQWKIAINRALALKPRIIFMDEPTASLTYEEVKELFESIRHLRESGTAIVYVSHRIEEIFEIADRVTVIKDGSKVGSAPVRVMDVDGLYKMMLGRGLRDIFPQRKLPQDETCLEVQNLTRAPAVNDVSFSVRRGEVLGIAGLIGSGRTELVRLLFGADRKDRGEISVNGTRVQIRSPQDAIRCGMAMVPEERRSQGVVLTMGIKHNITLAGLSRFRRWVRIPVIAQHKENAAARSLVESTGIRTQDLNKAVGLLSGGNQQKCVLAKWLCRGAKIFIFDEPTRGIDIGSRVSIYRMIADLAAAGAGVVLISSDLTEVMGLSHRILILKNGTKRSELDARQTDLKTVLGLCLGEDGLTALETKTAAHRPRQEDSAAGVKRANASKS